MGKKNVSQRTKGNAKPSSSARSAELLFMQQQNRQHQKHLTGAAHNTANDFMLVPAVGSPIFGLTPLSPEEEALIPSEMKVAIRKMSKRDATTRLKAIQEFSEICGSDAEDRETDNDSFCTATVKAVLPFWPRLYCRLATDQDRRVREACQKAHLTIVGIVGRDLAPHLKALTPVWHLSRSDPHSPAALLAQKAFVIAFPAASKRKDALLFCQNEVLTHIHDNLSNQSTLAAASIKTLDPIDEGPEAKMARIVVCSISGYTLFLEEVSNSSDGASQDGILANLKRHLSKSRDLHTSILQDTNLWTLYRHENPVVRMAWYSLMKFICQNMSCFFDEDLQLLADSHRAKLVSAVLGNLDESNGMVSPQVWDAALFVLNHLQDKKDDMWCDQAVLKDKVLRKVLKVLSSACYKGQISPVNVYPKVLPLIAAIAPNLNKEKQDFCNQVMDAIKIGLQFWMDIGPRGGRQQLQSLRNSNAANSARLAVSAYFDVAWLSAASNDSLDMCEDAIGNVLSWIKELLHDCTSTADFETDVVFHAMGHFLPKLDNKARSQFLSELRASTQESLADQRAKHLEAVVLLVSGLLPVAPHLQEQPLKFSSRAKEHRKLKFSVDPETEGVEADVFETEFFQTLSSHSKHDDCDLMSWKEVMPFMQDWLVALATDALHQISCAATQQDLHSLLDCFKLLLERLSDKITTQSLPEFYHRLCASLHLQDDAEQLASVGVVNHLLAMAGSQPSVFTSCTEHIISLCCTVARSVPRPDIQQLVERLLQLNTELSVAVIAALCKSHLAQDLFACETFRKRLLSTVECLHDRGNISFGTWNLLALIFLNEKDVDDDLLQLAISGANKASDLNPPFIKDLCLFLQKEKSVLTRLLSLPEGKTFLDQSLSLVLHKSDRLGFWMRCMEKFKPSASCEWAANALETIRHEIRDGDAVRRDQLVLDPGILSRLVQLLFRAEMTWSNIFDAFHDRAEYDRSSYIGIPFLSLLLKPPVQIAVWDVGSSHADEAAMFEADMRKLDFLLNVVDATFKDQNSAVLDTAAEDAVIPHLICGMKLLVIPWPENTTNKMYQDRLVSSCKHWFITMLSERAQISLLNQVLALSDEHGLLHSLSLLTLCRWLTDHKLTLDSFINLGTMLQSSSSCSPSQIQTQQVLLQFAPHGCISDLIHQEVDELIRKEWSSPYAKYDLLKALEILVSCLTPLSADKEQADSKDIIKALQVIIDFRQDHEGDFLFSRDVSECEWRDVHWVVTVTRFLKLAANFVGHILEPGQWDFVLCSLSSWIQSAEEHSCKLIADMDCNSMAGVKAHVFTLAIVDLSRAAAECINCSEQKQLTEEWHEFFAEGIFSFLLNFFVQLAQDDNSEKTVARTTLLISLGQCLKHIPNEQLRNHQLPAKYVVDDVDASVDYPESLVSIMNHLSPLLSSSSSSSPANQVIQLTAFHLLDVVMDQVVECEEAHHHKHTIKVCMAASSTKNEDHDDEGQIDEMHELPRRLMDQLYLAEPVLMALFSLSDLEFGEPIPEMFPDDSAAFLYTYSLLLTWKLILKLVGRASSELRPKYCEFLRRKGHFAVLMKTLFHLMTMTGSTDDSTASYFTKEPRLSYDREGQPDSALELKLLACSVYYVLLRDLPALVRSWWKQSDRKIAILIEKFTMQEVSGLLWQEEMQRIQESAKSTSSNMKIKVRSNVREVLAIYKLDEGSMELVIKVPANFPLGAVSVESGNRIGVSTVQWRTWMLQLTTFLLHQNGSIMEGLMSWKRNLDKRFEGIEECYICYYILHGASHQLPKLACRTCKKKFHSACLYKWFSTSNNSSCPLCRNLF